MKNMENASGCPALDQLIQSSKTLDDGKSAQEDYHLKWIPYSELTNIELIEHSTGKQPTYYAMYERAKRCVEYIDNSSDKYIEILLLGTVDECTQEFIHEFGRTFSLPTHKYDKP